jgi:hypothetical protein
MIATCFKVKSEAVDLLFQIPDAFSLDINVLMIPGWGWEFFSSSPRSERL